MRRRTNGLLSKLLRGPWTPLRLTGVTFGFLIFGVALTGGQRFYNYTQEDPTFCRSCHTMENAWTKWQTSEHTKVTCHACHESSPVESMQQIVVYAMNRPNDVSKHAIVDSVACEKCHESGNPEWKQVADTAGHKVHAEQNKLECVTCHGVNLHRFQPPAEICTQCHTDKTIKLTKMANRYCLDCHNFLRENSPLRPTRDACLDCHLKQTQSTVHWPTGAPMQFQCSQCHQPHKSVKPTAGCLSCHQNIKQTGLHSRPVHSNTDCAACHRPHEWKVETRDACLTCHANKTEHNKNISCANCHNFKKA